MADRTFWRQFGVSILIAMAGVLIVWFLAALISPDIRVDTTFDENEKLQWYGPPLAMIFPYGIGAAIVSWLLVRYQKPRMWLYAITVIALIGMGLQAFAQADTTESAIWLNVMHLVAVACIVPVVARFLPET